MIRKADVVVIGAGASGLMAAIAAAEKGASVILTDGNAKAGRKLYATGNGRCNYTNAWIRSERPVSENAENAVADPPETIASKTGKPDLESGRSGERAGRSVAVRIPDILTAEAGDRIPGSRRLWKPEMRMTPSSGEAAQKPATEFPGIPAMRLNAGNPVSRSHTDGSVASREVADDWYYNHGEDGFVGEVLARFDAAAAMAFFRESGMLTRQEDEGRCYPYSGQAATVVRVLERRALEAGVMFHMGDVVSEVRWQPERERARGKAARAPEGSPDHGVFVATCRSGCQLVSGALVIACGGRAGLKFGSTGDGYGFAKAFGHTLAPPRPALVPVESGDPAMPRLKGIRVRAAATLSKNGKAIAGESGEVQFTGTGLSGICVFNLTRFMEAPRPRKGKKTTKKRTAGMSAEEADQYAIVLDLTPDIPEEELWDFLCGNAGGYRDSRASDSIGDGFCGCSGAGTRRDPAVPDGASDRFFRGGEEGGYRAPRKKTDSDAGHRIQKRGSSPDLDRRDPVRRPDDMEREAGSGRFCGKVCMPYDRMQILLSGILPENLASVIVDLAAGREAELTGTGNDGAAGDGKAAGQRFAGKGRLRTVRAEAVLRLLKTFPVPVSATRGWDAAQVTAGGVRREELDPSTMQSRLKKGLYFCGEVVDVDGRCGGYNLQWAWASGRAAGQAAASKQREAQIRGCMQPE